MNVNRHLASMPLWSSLEDEWKEKETDGKGKRTISGLILLFLFVHNVLGRPGTLESVTAMTQSLFPLLYVLGLDT